MITLISNEGKITINESNLDKILNKYTNMALTEKTKEKIIYELKEEYWMNEGRF